MISWEHKVDVSAVGATSLISKKSTVQTIGADTSVSGLRYVE